MAGTVGEVDWLVDEMATLDADAEHREDDDPAEA
jgi:hypothetical protein